MTPFGPFEFDAFVDSHLCAVNEELLALPDMLQAFVDLQS
jgi:hypothetical protein